MTGEFEWYVNGEKQSITTDTYDHNPDGKDTIIQCLVTVTADATITAAATKIWNIFTVTDTGQSDVSQFKIKFVFIHIPNIEILTKVQID